MVYGLASDVSFTDENGEALDKVPPPGRSIAEYHEADFGPEPHRPDREGVDVMMPIGPLMIEHRLIERMVRVLDEHLAAVGSGTPADPALLGSAVDFFRVYADRTHHGKEEDILFRALRGRELNDEHLRIMDELVEEHKTARRLVGQLKRAAERIALGDDQARGELQECLRKLVALYVPHIEKEDKQFFRPAMDYFSADEQQSMLQKFREFDASMIHEAYRNIVERFETRG
jgi:hemerythrin-like domain-containing protein